ncbi:MAG: ribonuclease HIII [Halanaerobiaceae bacterium]
MNKFELFEEMRFYLLGQGFDVENYKEINYGLQFRVNFQGKSELVRIFESKKQGTRLDLSQVKDEEISELIRRAEISAKKSIKNKDKSIDNNVTEGQAGAELGDYDDLIGVDESGKGDYFGPLVIAGVYLGKEMARKLIEYGVDDSKNLSDGKISKLAIRIKNNCEHSIVTIKNPRYNQLHNKIGNLNKILAWGHARVIENLLDKVDCYSVLSDKFAKKHLIEDALMEKGREIKLEQRVRAESNLAVAAASILARAEFVSQLQKLSEKYEIEFPKGAANHIIDIGQEFVKRYGQEELSQVAKLHFKTTDKILDLKLF